MTLKTIEELTKRKQYYEALDACDYLEASNPELKSEIRRQRSYIFTRRSDYAAAVKERAAIIEAGDGTIGDYDSAAFWTCYDGQFQQALDWYLKALRLGEEQNETWFRSNELFLIAFLYMELEEFEKAVFFLDKLEGENEDTDATFLIPNIGFGTVAQLRDEIRRRASGNSN